jgi:hypothetical protein
MLRLRVLALVCLGVGVGCGDAPPNGPLETRPPAADPGRLAPTAAEGGAPTADPPTVDRSPTGGNF